MKAGTSVRVACAILRALISGEPVLEARKRHPCVSEAGTPTHLRAIRLSFRNLANEATKRVACRGSHSKDRKRLLELGDRSPTLSQLRVERQRSA
jgi:hypothetical protein